MFSKWKVLNDFKTASLPLQNTRGFKYSWTPSYTQSFTNSYYTFSGRLLYRSKQTFLNYSDSLWTINPIIATDTVTYELGGSYNLVEQIWIIYERKSTSWFIWGNNLGLTWAHWMQEHIESEIYFKQVSIFSIRRWNWESGKWHILRNIICEWMWVSEFQ